MLTSSFMRFATKQKRAQPVKAAQSLHEKLRDVDTVDGTVLHKHILTEDGKSRLSFADAEEFKQFLAQKTSKRNAKLRARLTPFQYYVTQGMGSERPFTGAYWDTKDAGTYSCVVCSQRLFMFDHKYVNKSGLPTFWSHLKDAVKLTDDALEIATAHQYVEDPTLMYKQPVKRCSCSHVSP